MILFFPSGFTRPGFCKDFILKQPTTLLSPAMARTMQTSLRPKPVHVTRAVGKRAGAPPAPARRNNFRECSGCFVGGLAPRAVPRTLHAMAWGPRPAPGDREN